MLFLKDTEATPHGHLPSASHGGSVASGFASGSVGYGLETAEGFEGCRVWGNGPKD